MQVRQHQVRLYVLPLGSAHASAGNHWEWRAGRRVGGVLGEFELDASLLVLSIHLLSISRSRSSPLKVKIFADIFRFLLRYSLLFQVPLSNLVHLRGGEITTNQHEPGLDRMTTIGSPTFSFYPLCPALQVPHFSPFFLASCPGFSLLGAPRQSLDRRSTGEVFKNPRSPYGLEGNFHLDIGPVRAVYQVGPFLPPFPFSPRISTRPSSAHLPIPLFFPIRSKSTSPTTSRQSIVSHLPSPTTKLA